MMSEIIQVSLMKIHKRTGQIRYAMPLNGPELKFVTYNQYTATFMLIWNFGGIMDEGTSETVEELREKLRNMKKLIAQRQLQELEEQRNPPLRGIINGNFLSMAFMVALFVIITTGIYTFHKLYSAIVKKFTPPHDEL